MKFLHKFLNKADIPWVNIIWETYYQTTLPGDRQVGSFWWKSVCKLIPDFKKHAICKAGVGDTALFWSDNWNGRPLSLTYPELFSFAMDGLMVLSKVMEQPDFSQFSIYHYLYRHISNSTHWCKILIPERQVMHKIDGTTLGTAVIIHP